MSEDQTARDVLFPDLSQDGVYDHRIVPSEETARDEHVSWAQTQMMQRLLYEDRPVRNVVLIDMIERVQEHAPDDAIRFYWTFWHIEPGIPAPFVSEPSPRTITDDDWNWARLNVESVPTLVTIGVPK